MRTRYLTTLLLLALVLVGCFGTEHEWVYPGKGWAVDVGHHNVPDRIYRDSGTNSFYRPNEGYQILALWLTVANLDDTFSYTLRSDVSSWRIVDGGGKWAQPMVRNYEFEDSLQTQQPFVFGEPKSGYLYFRIPVDFDLQTALLEFRYYGMGQGHLVIVDLSEVQPLSNTM